MSIPVFLVTQRFRRLMHQRLSIGPGIWFSNSNVAYSKRYSTHDRIDRNLAEKWTSIGAHLLFVLDRSKKLSKLSSPSLDKMTSCSGPCHSPLLSFHSHAAFLFSHEGYCNSHWDCRMCRPSLRCQCFHLVSVRSCYQYEYRLPSRPTSTPSTIRT